MTVVRSTTLHVGNPSVHKAPRTPPPTHLNHTPEAAVWAQSEKTKLKKLDEMKLKFKLN